MLFFSIYCSYSFPGAIAFFFFRGVFSTTRMIKSKRVDIDFGWWCDVKWWRSWFNCGLGLVNFLHTMTFPCLFVWIWRSVMIICSWSKATQTNLYILDRKVNQVLCCFVWCCRTVNVKKWWSESSVWLDWCSEISEPSRPEPSLFLKISNMCCCHKGTNLSIFKPKKSLCRNVPRWKIIYAQVKFWNMDTGYIVINGVVDLVLAAVPVLYQILDNLEIPTTGAPLRFGSSVNVCRVALFRDWHTSPSEAETKELQVVADWRSVYCPSRFASENVIIP